MSNSGNQGKQVMEEARRRARLVLGDEAPESQVAKVATELARTMMEAQFERQQKEFERQQKEKLVELQVWKYGVPPLELAGGCGTPSSSSHHEVTVVPCEFVAVKNLEWSLLHKSTLYSGDVKPNKPLKYASEGDVARYSYSCLSDVLYGLKRLNGLGIELFNEYTVASLRPDLVVMIANGRPVGYCEVKKPNVVGLPERPLEDGKVLGQAYDYVMALRHEHGVQWAFALVTTFTHWRAVWLDDGTSRDAATLDSTGHDRKCFYPPVAADPTVRRLCVSDIINAEGNAAIGNFLGSVLLKMISSSVLDTPASDRLWPWLSNRGMTWRKLNVSDSTVVFPPNPRPPFARVRQLGVGRDGMCWEVIKGNTRLALKIMRKREGVVVRDAAAEEAKRWKTIWGIRARAVEVMGRAALVMPLVSTFRSNEEFRKWSAEASDALRHIANLRCVHNDLRHNDGTVKWEHFGLLTEQDGSQRLIVLDLSDMGTVNSEREAIETMRIDELLAVDEVG